MKMSTAAPMMPSASANFVAYEGCLSPSFVHTVLNTALTYWITFVEKGVVYQGVAPKGEKVPTYLHGQDSLGTSSQLT